MMTQLMMMPLISISLMAIITSNPISIVVIIGMQTLIIAMMTGLTQSSFWFGYSLFLVFLGGLLILFSYISSLASNDTFSMPMLSILTIFMMTIAMTVVFMMKQNTPSLTSTHESMTSTTSITNIMNKLYYQMSSMTIMMFIYLLITLLIVAELTMSQKGPLQVKI